MKQLGLNDLTNMKPKLAAFPKCYIDDLCVHQTMTLFDWIEMASTLGVDGLEFYSGFLKDEPAFLEAVKDRLEKHRLQMPMLCCSPDFTQPNPELLNAEIEREKRMIELTAFFGGKFCRVLSGQRYPEVSREDGVSQVVTVLNLLLSFAEKNGVILTMENHYKDGFWRYPEFAQRMDVFLEIVEQIDSPWFGVNFDPSNTVLAGEDPIELLKRIKHRVVSMHASDRYLTSGTIEDLRKEENEIGYANRLAHGVIGKGLNDYDAIFTILSEAGFDSWISIEDGMNGMGELRDSVRFLQSKIERYFSV
jgi:sugar phosphate isomerase/epimerase